VSDPPKCHKQSSLPERLYFYLLNALSHVFWGSLVVAVLINEDIAFLLFSVNVDQNDVDPSTLKLCIFRTRTNFYTTNTDSESASDKLSTGVFFTRVGGGDFRPPLEGGVPGPKK